MSEPKATLQESPYEDALEEYAEELQRLALRILVALMERRLPLAALAEGRSLDPLGKDLMVLAGLQQEGDDEVVVELLPHAHQHLRELDARTEARRQASLWSGTPTPLGRLHSVFSLSAAETDVILFALAPVLDPRFLAIFAAAQGARFATGPSLGLAVDVLADSPSSRSALWSGLLEGGRLLQEGLLVAEDSAGAGFSYPSQRQFSVSPRVTRYLLGDDGPHPSLRRLAYLQPPLRRPERLVVDEGLREGFLSSVVESLEGALPMAVSIEGPVGVGRKTLAGLGAGARGRPVLVVDLELARAGKADPGTLLQQVSFDCRLMDWLPLILVPRWLGGTDLSAASMTPGGEQDRRALRAALDRFLVAWPSVCFLVGEQRLPSCQLPGGPAWLRVPLEQPSVDARAALWRLFVEEAGATAKAEDLEVVAAKFSLNGQEIRRSVYEALEGAKQRGVKRKVQLRGAALEASAAAGIEAAFGAFGRRVRATMTWDDLVLESETWNQLKEVVAFARQRSTLLEEWGFGRKLERGSGVTIMFAGPPGTGKTCTAEILATELSMDLFKIDASRLIDKYVGETEKQLDRLFAMARDQAAVLLFDEAEALFGARVSGESATDRYANMQTTVLLQRIEESQGVVILTTNLPERIDEAFKRRLSFQIRFPFPQAEARAELWEALVPDEAPLARDVDFGVLGEQFEMPGGHIKNAVLRAAAQAADEGKKISAKHLSTAARTEYAAMGKLIRVD